MKKELMPKNIGQYYTLNIIICFWVYVISIIFSLNLVKYVALFGVLIMGYMIMTIMLWENNKR